MLEVILDGAAISPTSGSCLDFPLGWIVTWKLGQIKTSSQSCFMSDQQKNKIKHLLFRWHHPKTKKPLDAASLYFKDRQKLGRSIWGQDSSNGGRRGLPDGLVAATAKTETS